MRLELKSQAKESHGPDWFMLNVSQQVGNQDKFEQSNDSDDKVKGIAVH